MHNSVDKWKVLRHFPIKDRLAIIVKDHMFNSVKKFNMSSEIDFAAHTIVGDWSCWMAMSSSVN